MTPRRAAQILNVSLDDLSAEDVRAAFVAGCRANHPDAADAPVGRVKLELAELKVARDVLARYVREQSELTPCPNELCSDGRVPTRRGGAVKCPTCAGEGVVRRKEVRRG